MGTVQCIAGQTKRILPVSNDALARRRGAEKPSLSRQSEVTLAAIARTAIGKSKMPGIDIKPLPQPFSASREFGHGRLWGASRDPCMRDRVSADFHESVSAQLVQHVP